MCFKEGLDKKVIGEVKFIEVRRYIKGDYKGVVYEFMPHFIDCILVLMNFDTPVEITGILENPKADWDELGFVYTNIRFKNGVSLLNTYKRFMIKFIKNNIFSGIRRNYDEKRKNVELY